MFCAAHSGSEYCYFDSVLGCVNILAAFPYRGGFTPTDPSSTYIALRWSAATNNVDFYRHIAPLEQRGIFRDKGFFTPDED